MSRYRASSRKPYYKENKDEKMLSIFVMLSTFTTNKLKNSKKQKQKKLYLREWVTLKGYPK